MCLGLYLVACVIVPEKPREKVEVGSPVVVAEHEKRSKALALAIVGIVILFIGAVLVAGVVEGFVKESVE